MPNHALPDRVGHPYEVDARRVQNPYLEGMPALIGLVGLCLLGLAFTGEMVRRGAWPHAALWYALLPGALFAFVLATVWVMGQRTIGRIENFLASDRPLLRWTYSDEEWHEMRSASWREAQSDWKVQFGCMTALFGLVGLLVGAGLALDDLPASHVGFEDVLNVVGGVMPWTAGGLLAGALLGVVVAGGNYLAARAAAQQRTPGEVALGREELFANDDYFSGRWAAYIKSINLDTESEPGQPVLTIVTRHPWRPRGPEDTWAIRVPPRLREEVQRVVPLLAKKREEE